MGTARLRHFPRVVAALAVAVGVLVAPAAAAQAQWYEHYQRGVELERQGSWEAAVPELEAAVRGEPRARTRIGARGRTYVPDYDPHYHLAHCLVELERYAAAGMHLRLAYKAAVTPRRLLDPLAERIEAAVRERLTGTAAAPTGAPSTRLEVTGEPAGATVTLDGVARGTTPLGPVEIAPGAHLVRLEKPGYLAEEQRILLEPGTTFNLAPVLRPVAASARPSAAAPARGTAPPALVPPLEPRPSTPEAHAGGTAAPATLPEAAVVRTPASSPAGHPAWPRRRLAIAVLAVVGAALLATVALLITRRRKPAGSAATAATRRLDTTPTTVRSGQTLGAYELSTILGRGGMATTYRGLRTTDGSTVAVKVPHEGCLADPTFVARFLREGALGEQLHHPRIVRIFEAGEQDGRPFLAMELLAGRTLKEELRQRGPLPPRRALEIAADIAEALDYAHAKGVIHRDLKPENVMLLPDQTLKVMDFGIAHLAGQEGLTSSQFFLGTPLYAAPEMIDPKHVDHRADLYSLGIILFEMLEGTVPFSADSPFRVLQMHQHDPLPRRESLRRPVPEALWRVIEKLCAKSPDDRCPSAQALLVELHSLLRDPGSLAETGGGETGG